MQSKLPRQLLKLAFGVVAVIAVTLVGTYVKWTTLDHRLVTITPGTVYQSAAYDPDELVALCEDKGIRTIIDLRDSKPAEVAAACKAATAAGLNHLHLPTKVQPEEATVRAFLAAMDQAERPVLVHCQHGEGRSVMMCAIHRVENEGWTNEGAFQATARLPHSLRFLSDWFPCLCRFRDTADKGRFVLDYNPGDRTVSKQ